MRATDAVVAVAALLLAGCPRFSNDGLACGTGGACPPGFHCAADHRCWRMGQNPDLSASLSGGGHDLAGADLPGALPGADLAGSSSNADMSASLALGQLCSTPGQCASGNCVDGVCCDSACTGPCMSCNQSSSLGKCTAVPTGNTPSHGTCGPDMMSSCGRNGKCDGSGNCQKWDSTTVCKTSTCTGSTYTAPSLCDGAGSCVTPASTSCGVYNCDGTNNVCFTSCSGSGFTDGHCNQAGGSPGCNSGSCGARANGQPCTAGSDCKSTICDSITSLCCDMSPCGGCKSCKYGSTVGFCTNVTSGDPNNACPTNATNCVAGGCSNGACIPSSSSTVCYSSCASTNQLTEAKCNGTSTGCPSPGGATACAGYLVCADTQNCKQSCSGQADCVYGACSGGNCVIVAPGQQCSQDSQCGPGMYCTDNVCCNVSSCGGCYACNVNGQGTCAPVPAGQDPHGVCSSIDCYSGCDGSGSCKYKCGTTQKCACGGMCICSSCSCP